MSLSVMKKWSKNFAAPIAAFCLAACGCYSSGSESQVYDQLQGEWSILAANGVSTKEGTSPATIMFNEDGRISGNATVNRFFGDYTFDGDELRLEHLGLTRMMGPNMHIENAVVEAINSVHSVRVHGDKAAFYDVNGNEIMSLVRMK